MPAAVERRLTLFADHPDPSRELWIGFVEVLVSYDDGRQVVDVHTLDDGYTSRAMAMAAAEAWVAQYKANAGDGGPPIIVERL